MRLHFGIGSTQAAGGQKGSRGPARAGRGASRALLGVIAVLGVGCAGDAEGDRFAAQAELGRAARPEINFAVSVEPGPDPVISDEPTGCAAVARALGLEAAPFSLDLRASAPTPTVRLEYGNREPFVVEAQLANVAPEAYLVPTLRTYRGCVANRFDGDAVLAPLPHVAVSADRPQVRRTCIPMRRCTRLDLAVVTPEELDPGDVPGALRVAVIGEIEGNDETLSAALDDIAAWPADVIVALGNLANSATYVDLLAFRGRVEEAGIPLVAALSPTEADGGALLPFHEIFGRSDFTFAVGDVRLAVLDTSAGGLSEAQYAYWSEELLGADAGDTVALAFMSVPPFDPAGARNDGFASRTEAARLVTLLGERGVDAAFTAGIGSFARQDFAGVPYYATGGGGRSLESGSAYGQHYLRVTATPGASEPVSVSVREF